MNTPPASERQPTVLCIDDEANVLSSLSRLLRRDGWRVLLATRGESALEMLEDVQIDVVICDHQMPGMNGIDVLRRVKEMSPETIRILLSGHWCQEEVVTPAVNEIGVFRLLGKPWDNDQIREAVMSALGGDPKEWLERHRRIQSRLAGDMGCSSLPLG